MPKYFIVEVKRQMGDWLELVGRTSDQEILRIAMQNLRRLCRRYPVMAQESGFNQWITGRRRNQ